MQRIGEILVDRGWISPEQLTRALKNQSMLGGRLGTSLLEMGVISEDLLLRALSDQHQVPPASISDLRNVPAEVRRLLPAHLAQRHQVVPIRLLGGKLDVAMSEVRDLSLQDELAFVTGKTIQPHIANEVRISEALDRYYGAECSSRHGRLLDRLNRLRTLWEQEGEGDDGMPPAPPEQGEAAAESVAPEPGAVPLQPPRPAPPPKVAAHPSPLPAPQGDAESVTPVAASSPPAVASAASGARASSVESRLEELDGRLTEVRDTDAIGRLLLGFLRQDFDRVLLFQASRTGVAGWMGVGPGVDATAVAGCAIDFDRPSVFLNLLEGAPLHFGPLPLLPTHRELAACWGAVLPADCVVVPIRLRSRLVAVLYGDRGPRGLAGIDVETLQRLAAKISIAFEMCIMRKKLRRA